MQPTDELAAVGRIVIAIKTYRAQTSDYQDPTANDRVDSYLKQHLSAQDWLLWQRLPLGRDAIHHKSCHEGVMPQSSINYRATLEKSPTRADFDRKPLASS